MIVVVVAVAVAVVAVAASEMNLRFCFASCFCGVFKKNMANFRAALYTKNLSCPFGIVCFLGCFPMCFAFRIGFCCVFITFPGSTVPTLNVSYTLPWTSICIGPPCRGGEGGKGDMGGG